MRISAIIVTWNSAAHLTPCVGSLEGLDEIIVVDNASHDRSLDVAHGLGLKVIENSVNEGFARACNTGAEAASGEALLFVNPDTVARPGAIAALSAVLTSDARCGAVGPRLVDADGTPQPAVDEFLTPGHFLARAARRIAGGNPRPEWLYGAFLLVRRDVFERVGGFDRDYHMYYEDMDLCWKIRAAGYTVRLESRAEVVHLGGASAAQRWDGFPAEQKALSLLTFQRKRAPSWQVGPFRVAAAASYGAYALILAAGGDRARARAYAHAARTFTRGR